MPTPAIAEIYGYAASTPELIARINTHYYDKDGSPSPVEDVTKLVNDRVKKIYEEANEWQAWAVGEMEHLKQEIEELRLELEEH